jgi:ubiquinone/menaquinone biosynthesis C-methylase UbiE
MRGIEHIPWLYDASMVVIEWTGLSRWRRWLAQGVRGATLEVGCGTGRNLPLYAVRSRVVALELDRRLLHAARRRASHIPLVVGDAEALPFRARQFDTVTSSLVFCSVRDPAAGLREVRRVLRPGGELRMLEHVRATSHIGGALQDAIQPAWTWITGGCHPNRDTEAAVRAAGFVIVPETRRARDVMRRFVALADEHGRTQTNAGEHGR